jgi:tetratricopeptide (TPR) repeat protein
MFDTRRYEGTRTMRKSGANVLSAPYLRLFGEASFDNCCAACHGHARSLLLRESQRFRRLLKLQPNSLAGRAGRGQAFFNLRRYDEAGADFVAATGLRPAPQLFLMAGKSLEGAGKLAEAEAEYRKALARDSGFAEARERLDVLERRLGTVVVREN